MKKISIIVAVAIMFFPQPTICSNAGDIYEAFEEGISESAGLIHSTKLECSVGTKKLHIDAETVGTDYMLTIGINNIHIQRSSDNSNWYDEKTVSGDYNYYTDYYRNSNYEVSVLGNYYYRVVLDHYAYDGSISESIGHTSNSVWIA